MTAILVMFHTLMTPESDPEEIERFDPQIAARTGQGEHFVPSVDVAPLTVGGTRLAAQRFGNSLPVG